MPLATVSPMRCLRPGQVPGVTAGERCRGQMRRVAGAHALADLGVERKGRVYVWRCQACEYWAWIEVGEGDVTLFGYDGVSGSGPEHIQD